MAASSSYTRTKLILRVNTGCAFVYLGGKRVEETNEQITYIVHNTVFFPISVSYLEINDKELFLICSVITRIAFGLIIIKKSYTAVPCISFSIATSLSVNLRINGIYHLHVGHILLRFTPSRLVVLSVLMHNSAHIT